MPQPQIFIRRRKAEAVSSPSDKREKRRIVVYKYSNERSKCRILWWRKIASSLGESVVGYFI